MKLFKYLFFWILTLIFLIGVGFGIYIVIDSFRGLIAFILVLAILYFLNLFTTIIIFIQRRNSQAKLSWVMCLATIPILGHVIFVIFGKRYKGRTSLEEYKKEEEAFMSIQQKSSNDENTKNVLLQQKQISSRPILDANIKLLSGGDKAYDQLFKDIAKAKKFIHIHYYIIKPGEIWEELKQLLIKKSKDGVVVRVIVDDFGRWAMPEYEIKQLMKKGVIIKVFGKVHFPFISYQNGFRSHRKIVIIDGHTAHVGGLNISDEYAHYTKKYGYWADSQIKIKGPASRQYALLFLSDWKRFFNETLSDELYAPLIEYGTNFNNKSIMVEDGPNIRFALLENSLINWINTAKKKIKLCTPYFILTNALVDSLKRACLSGVEVEIYIPGFVDKKSAEIGSSFYSDELIPFGIKVFKLNKIFLHSKMGVFDNEYAYLGTMNIDVRSLYSQFEVVSLMQGHVVKDINKLFNKYKSISTLIKLKTNKRGLIHRVKTTFVKIMTPLM